jgi:general stress protein 26
VEHEAVASSPSEMVNLSARDAWLATQNGNGSPHLVPIWFVAQHADSIWIATGLNSTKVTNIRNNSQLSIGFPAEGDSGDDSVAIGIATLHEEAPSDVVSLFVSKYQWHPGPEPDPDVGELLFIEINPRRWMMGSPAPTE